ncbi:Parafibromin [Auxenochlorella protothecoides]|uniref:Parafibromin n=2 Tax=Auxenochlorella protothecoides TaxID=3075 RepID=A0A087SLL6_AUXPR|nr:Parafibromin [Auxenochlorella protothecoides]KFM26620.1 Parafibromin [Auxenochlorella protothecoides]
MDPLRLLREYVSGGRLEEVTTVGDRVHFGTRFALPRSARTAYKSQAKDGAFYDLGALLFYARNLGPTFKYADYFKKAREAGVGQVTFIDRKDLELYLTGKIDKSAAIEEGPQDLGPVEGPEAVDPGLPPLGAPSEEAAGPGGVGGKEGDAEEATLRRVLANELQLRDRNSMLLVPGRSFHKVLALLRAVQADEACAPLTQPKKKEGGGGSLPVAPSGRYERETAQDATLRTLGAQQLGISSVAFTTAGARAPGSGRPIIMVPPGLTSMVNMYNIGPLLETGTFKPAEGVRKSDRLIISRTMGRAKPVAYEVTDQEPRHRRDWDRVVAVFCSGKAWQFKKWPFPGASSGDLLDTFQRMAGAYLHYQDEQIDPAVKAWKVKVYSLSREGRHRDIVIAQDFFKTLDAFLQAKKSTLAY